MDISFWKGKGETMSLQEFERKYSYLLSWEDAEKKVGRRLDWNNNFDCCLYHDLLVEAVNANACFLGLERQVKKMNGMQIWEVNGIDDLEGTCFAQCSTKEKAEKAMQILEENGFEDMLEVEQSNLRLDQLVIQDKIIQL